MSLLQAAQNTLGNILAPFGSIESPSYRGQDFPEGIVFQEYDSDGKPSGLPFGLIGSQMPKDRVPWGGTQNAPKEWYAGNPEPTIHVMGARENDIKLQGHLKDKKIQDPTRKALYGAATAVAEQIDAARKKGSIVKMTMGEFVRYGMFGATVFRTKTLGDVEYDIDFLVIGEKFPTNCKFLKTSLALPEVSNTLLIAAAAKFAARAGVIPSTMPLGIAELINQAISDVALQVSKVTQFVDNVLTTAEDAGRLYERGLGLVRAARTSCVVFKKRIGAINLAIGNAPVAGTTAISEAVRAANALFALETLHSTSKPPDRETDFTRAAARAKVDQFTSKTSTREAAKAQRGGSSMESILRDIQKQLEKLSRSMPLRSVRVTQGMTLQKLAQTFYGDATMWEKIFKHNKLQSTVLVVGAVIEIPRL